MSQQNLPPGGLAPEELARYSRHLVLPEVGIEGQERLRRARVLIVGAGGLGSPLALYLAAAGVGRLGVVEFDRVDLSNLQRQILYGSKDIGRLKLDVAAERIAEINPHVRVEAHPTRLSVDNAMELIEPYDLVIDGTDNFPTRYLVNDACVLLEKPNVYGSIFRFEGQVSLFWGGRGPCYRCLYPEPPPAGLVPNCAEGGVLGVLPGIIGTLQATEALKWILGRGESLLGRLVLFDALELRFRELKLRRDPDCPICGEHPTITALSECGAACAALPAATPEPAQEISVSQLKQRLDRGERPLLIDVRTPQEWQICRLEGARLIPLHELPRRLGEIEAGREIVTYCHVGMRSAMAAALLREHGHGRTLNLSGGIEAWANEIEPSMPRY